MRTKIQNRCFAAVTINGEVRMITLRNKNDGQDVRTACHFGCRAWYIKVDPNPTGHTPNPVIRLSSLQDLLLNCFRSQLCLSLPLLHFVPCFSLLSLFVITGLFLLVLFSFSLVSGWDSSLWTCIWGCLAQYCLVPGLDGWRLGNGNSNNRLFLKHPVRTVMERKPWSRGIYSRV